MKTLTTRILILFSFLYCFSGLSARENIINKGNEVASDSASVSRHGIYAGAGMGYNMIYMGTSLSQGRPYYSGGLTYGFNNTLYASANVFHLNVYDPLVSFSSFSLSYNHTFNSWFDIALSGSRYQVNKSLTDTLFTSFFYIDGTLGFDWKILYTKISAGGILSESSGLYFQLRNSRYFETPEFLNGKAYFSFDPYVNLLFGTLTEMKDGTTVVTPPFGRGRSGGGGSSETTTKFSLMEADFGLPVTFNMGRFSISAEPGYVIPLYSDETSSDPGRFIFNMGLFFKIY